jgi:cytochrome c oxidase cbb3-type subunit 3
LARGPVRCPTPLWRFYLIRIAILLILGSGALAFFVAPGAVQATGRHDWPVPEAASPDEPPATPDPDVVKVLSQPGAMDEARRTFSVYCSECHGLAAGGGMGPPLTDPQTLYGGRYEDYIRIITNGSPNRPMPSWKAKLGEERIRLMAAFVYALRGTRAVSLPDAPPWPH